MSKKGNAFPFTRSREYQETVKQAQAALLTSLDPTLKAFWEAYDKDTQGNPEARLEAVKLARVLRDSYGMGARKAATIMGRDPGDNGAQRYFDVARGWSEGLVTEKEILSEGVGRLYSHIRECRQVKAEAEAQGKLQVLTEAERDKAIEAARMAEAVKAFEKIRAACLKADKEFNCLEVVTLWLTGEAGFLSAPEHRTTVKAEHIRLTALVAPEAPKVEGEAPAVEGEAPTVEASGVETVKVEA